MKVFKRLICLALIVLTLFSVSSFFASAANTSDWSWYKGIDGNTTCITGHRRKENDTSAYIKYEGGTANPVVVRVCGTNDSTTLGGKDTGSNMTLRNTYNNYNDYYNVYAGTERGLKNLVYENGVNYAYLKITVGSGKQASGLWSPDSVGNYN